MGRTSWLHLNENVTIGICFYYPEINKWNTLDFFKLETDSAKDINIINNNDEVSTAIFNVFAQQE